MVAEEMAFAAADAFAAVGPDVFTGPDTAGEHGLGVEKSGGRIRLPVGWHPAPTQQIAP